MLMAPKQKQPLGAPMTLGNMREMGVQRGARTTSIASSEALRRAYLRHGYALGLVSALGRR